MRLIQLLVVVVLLWAGCTGRVSGAAFAPGNVVVYRVGAGDGVTTLVNTGSAVFLDEYNPSGSLVQSIALPTAVSGSQKRLVASGTAVSEGQLSRSADGRYLILSGYDSAIPGASNLGSSASAAVNRVIGRVDPSGALDTTTALTDAATGNNVRSATSLDGVSLWIDGGAGGVRYAALGSTTSVQLSTTLTNLRQLQIFGGQLYVSTQSGTALRLATVGSGLPTTSGQILSNLPGFPTTVAANGYFFVDLSSTVAGLDTLYVADETTGGGQIQKFSLVGGSWVSNGTITAPVARGLTGIVSGTTVRLYASSGGDGTASTLSTLYTFSDSTGYNSAPTAGATASTLATFNDSSKAFRGVALAPETPTALALSPATLMLGAGGTQTFAASGGTRGYVYSISVNNSGGSIDPLSGLYSAGGTLGVNDTIKVVDYAGATATSTVTVSAQLIISPTAVTLAPRGSQTFGASGGSGLGYAFSLTTNGSGGSVTTGGKYTSGNTASSTDVVTLTDSGAHAAIATITVGAGVSVSPTSKTLAPKGTQTFVPAGGSGSGYVFTLSTNGSGGSVNSAGGYTAGPVGSVSDVLSITDSLGNTASVTISVTAALTITPASVSVKAGLTQGFSAANGSGSGYQFSLAANNSGGTINSASGVYSAGATGGVTDIVKVTDSLGAIASATVLVTGGLNLNPSALTVVKQGTQTFAASGGSGSGYTYTFVSNASGATFNAVTGKYIAGSTGKSTDVLLVTDSHNNSATATVTVLDASLPSKGNLLVYRVGDGAAALTSAATKVFLDEYNPAGTLLQSIPMPTTIKGAQRRLVTSGTAGSEGLSSLSDDGRYVALPGYDADPGTASIKSTSAATVNRVVGVFSGSGVLNTATALTDQPDSDNMRSAVVGVNGKDIWAVGNVGGVRYTTLGAAGASTSVSSTITSGRQLGIFNSQLYESSNGSIQLGTVGIGTPIIAGQTTATLPNFPTTGSHYGYFFADLDATPGTETLYIADDSGQLQKYFLSAGAWTAAGSVPLPTARSVAGVVTGTTVTLYVTAESALYSVTDATGPGGQLAAAPVLLATAAANTVMRGVTRVPLNPKVPGQPDVLVSKTTLAVAEGGALDNYTLTLAGIPSAPVSIVAQADAQLELSADGAVFTPKLTLTFMDTTPQTIIVRAVDDAIPEPSPHKGVIQHSVAAGSAAEYLNLTIPAVSANIKDNDSNTPPRIGAIPALAGAVKDPTNPPVIFSITDDEYAPSALTVTVLASSNPGVAPMSRINVLNNNDGTATLTVNPGGLGYSNILIQVSDPGGLTAVGVCAYAASAEMFPATRYHSGACNASGAVALDGQYMVVADDENQVLRVYDRFNSGLPVYGLNLTPAPNVPPLQSSDTDKAGLLLETDFEACTRVGNRLYVTGSYSNSSIGEIKINRSRLFAVDLSGSGAATRFAFAGRYDFLKADLIQWDNAGGHGKGQAYYNFEAAAALSVPPEIATLSGFNIEGMCMAPASTSTAYICFRAPIVPPGNRNKALIVPVTNFDTLAVSGGPAGTSGGTAGSAVFGAPIELDLGGRGIRDMQKNANDEYLIIAGPASDGSGSFGPNDFRVYTWDGQPGSNPVPHASNLTGMHPEGIVEVPLPLTEDSIFQVLSDNGDTVWYGDGVTGKLLPELNHQKSRSDWVRVGATGPDITSLVMTPTAPIAGQEIIFNVGSADPKTTFSWDFGDGTKVDYVAPSKNLGAIRKHIYAVDGVYTLSLTASLNGVTDKQVIPVFVAPIDEGLAAQLLNVTKLDIRLNFKATNRNTIQLSGALPAGFSMAHGAPVTVDIGDVVYYFGKVASSATNPVTRTDTTRGSFRCSPGGQFKIMLRQGDFVQYLARYGLSSNLYDVGMHDVPVGLRIGSEYFHGSTQANWQIVKLTKGMTQP